MRITVAKRGSAMKIMRILSIAVIALFISAPAINANSLTATNPMSGATVTVAPSAVSVTGQVPLIDAGNSMEVTDPQGKRVDDGVLAIDGASAVIGLKTLKVAGVYTVTHSLQKMMFRWKVPLDLLLRLQVKFLLHNQFQPKPQVQKLK